MFLYYCIIIAALLYGSTVKDYKFIALAVLVEFLLHKLAYNHLFLDFRSENRWFIYYMYATIQLPIMFLLYKLKSHFVITALILMNMTYNLSVPLSFFDSEYMYIYDAKTAVVRTIMLMELAYLGLLNQHVRAFIEKRWRVDTDYIDRIFRVRGWSWNISRNMA
jgi:hypothetical protein